MKNYIYLLIVFIIFLCICLVCKGCMNLYEGFVNGDDLPISISQNLTLTYDPNCKPVPADPCDPNPCLNGGSCSDDGICSCTGDWTGEHCEIRPIIPFKYNCCKTTYTCILDPDGDYDTFEKCRASCIEPIIPPPPPTPVWCGDTDPTFYSPCQMTEPDPNNDGYVSVDIKSCGSGTSGLCESARNICDQGTIFYRNKINACLKESDKDVLGQWPKDFTEEDICDPSNCTFKTNDTPELPNPNNNNLEFKNDAEYNIFIGFINIDNQNGWTFYIEESLAQPEYLPDIPTQFKFYEVPTQKSLHIRSNLDTPVWPSGNCIIVKSVSNIKKDFDYTGLTNLEWTFGSNLSTDISAVTGFNISVDINIFNGLSCDGIKTTSADPEKIKCDIKNMYTDTEECFGKIDGVNKCLAPGRKSKSFEHKINAHGMALNTNIINNNNSCGDGSVPGTPGECWVCGTGDDRCGKGHLEETTDASNCFANNIKDRWGCYKWWNDPNNTQAKNWLDKYKDNCPIYGWTYDELELQIKDETSNKNWNQLNVNCPGNTRPPWPHLGGNPPPDPDFSNECQSYKTSNLYTCQKKFVESDCNGYLKHNNKQVLINCKTKKNTLLQFVISHVM